MKIRCHANSIRLRVRKSDLEALNDIAHLSVRPRPEGRAIVAQVDPKKD